jgi:hypothetical protein
MIGVGLSAMVFITIIMTWVTKSFSETISRWKKPNALHI